ncbi:MAG TPA: ATP-dependent sacrificial sulfur transferase LarE [Synergistales bacterium]|nr:ATP-dependent sacrificial sulfur transferase LarE [Synergistales bacterium]
MDKAEKVRSFFRENPSTLVLLSGGVDSAVLAMLASEGAPGEIKALTFRTPLVKEDEVALAKSVAEMLGIELHIEDVDVTSDPLVSTNPGDRCYFCRKILHREAARYARTAGLAGIADGVQADDLDEYRPGVAAALEDGILHPLAEAGLTKSEIRELARAAGLPNSEKPAAPCLATRFPPGVKISRNWIERIAKGEEFLVGKGIGNSRIRFFPPGLASIEIEGHEMPRLLEMREEVFEALKGIGFPVVSLDLEGLKRGKMERFLEVE